MAISPLPAEDKRNPRTIEQARSLVRHVESLFMPWDIELLVAGFTDDCIVRFGVVPEFRGHDALREFFIARRDKQKGYRLKKQFRALASDIITNVWDGEWEDAATGRPMKGFGVEQWRMRDGKIALWEAAFNAWPADQAVSLAHMLG